MPYPSTVKLLKDYYRKANIYDIPHGGYSKNYNKHTDDELYKLLQPKDMGDYYIIPEIREVDTKNGVTRYKFDYGYKHYKNHELNSPGAPFPFERPPSPPPLPPLHAPPRPPPPTFTREQEEAYRSLGPYYPSAHRDIGLGPLYPN